MLKDGAGSAQFPPDPELEPCQDFTGLVYSTDPDTTGMLYNDFKNRFFFVGDYLTSVLLVKKSK